MLRVYIAVCFLITLASGQASLFTDVIGTWPTANPNWQGANTDLLTGDSMTSEFNIVGNETYSALRYASDSSFVYFRLQLGNANITTSPNGSYLIYIDRLGWQAPAQMVARPISPLPGMLRTPWPATGSSDEIQHSIRRDLGRYQDA